METIYCCPICGETLKQGECYYDMESDRMRVDHCPNGCDCEGMVVAKPPEPEE